MGPSVVAVGATVDGEAVADVDSGLAMVGLSVGAVGATVRAVDGAIAGTALEEDEGRLPRGGQEHHQPRTEAYVCQLVQYYCRSGTYFWRVSTLKMKRRA